MEAFYMDLADLRHSINKAEPVHSWIARQMPGRPHPQIVRPINYVKIATTTVAVLGGITFLSVAGPYILPIIQNRNLWAAISLIAVLLFTSGHMFNHIRKVPYVAGDGKGGVSYFAGGFQNQFGLETQIVAAICEYTWYVGSKYDADLVDRRRPLLCDYQPGAEDSSHHRPTTTEDRRYSMGWHHPCCLLLPAQCLPSEERRISILAATILVVLMESSEKL